MVTASCRHSITLPALIRTIKKVAYSECEKQGNLSYARTLQGMV